MSPLFVVVGSFLFFVPTGSQHSNGQTVYHGANLESDCFNQPPQSCNNARIGKWFFNMETGQCEQKMCTWGGFWTEIRCYKQCACKLPSDEGTRCASGNPGQRYYFNDYMEDCVPFQYNGCSGNSNNFKTFFDCEGKCKASEQEKEHLMRSMGFYNEYQFDAYANGLQGAIGPNGQVVPGSSPNHNSNNTTNSNSYKFQPPKTPNQPRAPPANINNINRPLPPQARPHLPPRTSQTSPQNFPQMTQRNNNFRARNFVPHPPQIPQYPPPPLPPQNRKFNYPRNNFFGNRPPNFQTQPQIPLTPPPVQYPPRNFPSPPTPKGPHEYRPPGPIRPFRKPIVHTWTNVRQNSQAPIFKFRDPAPNVVNHRTFSMKKVPTKDPLMPSTHQPTIDRQITLPKGTVLSKAIDQLQSSISKHPPTTVHAQRGSNLRPMTTDNPFFGGNRRARPTGSPGFSPGAWGTQWQG